MTSDAPDLMSELIRVLNFAAMCTDKGYVWSGHNLLKREAMVAEFHQKMLNLITQTGADALPPELVTAIASAPPQGMNLGTFPILRSVLDKG